MTAASNIAQIQIGQIYTRHHEMEDPLKDVIALFEELYCSYKDVIDSNDILLSSTNGSGFLSTQVTGILKHLKEEVLPRLANKTLEGTEETTNKIFETLRIQIQALEGKLSKCKNQ